MDCRQALRVIGRALWLFTALVLSPAQAAEPKRSAAAQREHDELQGMLGEAYALYQMGLPDDTLTLLAPVVERARASGDDEALAMALTMRSEALLMLDDLSAALQALQAGGALICASSLADTQKYCAPTMVNVGAILATMGANEAQAQLEEAIGRCRVDARPDLEARALNLLGETLFEHDALAEAERRHQEALELATRHDDVAQRGTALIGLGRVALERGLLPEAIARHQAALTLATQRDETYVVALAQLEQGRVWAQQGKSEAAAVSYLIALTLFGELGETYRHSDVKLTMGELLFELDQLVDAKETFQHTLELKTESGHAYGRMRALIGLGTVLARRYDPFEAEQRLEEGRALAVAIGSRSGEAAALRGLGENHLLRNDPTKAEPYTRRALDIFLALGVPKGQAEALLDLGRGCARLDQTVEAIRYNEQALELATRHGLVPLGIRAQRALAQTLHQHARLLRQQHKLAESEAAWRRSIDVAAQTGDHTLEATGTTGLATELVKQGRLPEAELAWRQSVELRIGQGTPKELVSAQVSLSDVLAAQGALSEAEATLQQAIEGMAAGGGHDPVTALLKLGDLQLALGRLDEAEQTYLESVTVAKDRDAPPDEVMALTHTATFLVSQERRAQAEALLAPCVERARSDTSPELEISCLIALTSAQVSPRAALGSARRAVKLAESTEALSSRALTQINLARAHTRLGHLRRAESTLRRGVLIAERAEEPKIQATGLLLLATVLDERGDTEEAEEARAAAAALED